MGRLNVKETVLALLFVAVNSLTLLAWFMLVERIADKQFEHYTLFIAAVAGLAFSAAIFSIAGIFITQGVLLYGSVAAAILIPFLNIPAGTPALVILSAGILLALAATKRIADELAFSLGFKLSKMFRSGVPLYFTATALIISFFYFLETKTMDAVEAFLPEPAFEITLKALAEPIKSLTGGASLRPDASVDEVIEEMIRQKLVEERIPEDRIPDTEMRMLRAAQRKELADRFGISLTGREKMADVFREIVAVRIHDLMGPYRVYLPHVAAIAFFLAFKTLTVPLYFLSFALAFLLIKIMIAGKILKKETKQVNVQRITL